MITFYPGPSKLYPQVEAYLRDAFHSGLLSMNHRSQPFMSLLSEAITLLKNRLGIPDPYEVVFTSSATECWEIIAQSLTPADSYHLHNGAFGQKWQEYAHRIHGRSVGRAYEPDEQPPPVPEGHGDQDLLCLTHTETSNGTVIAGQSLELLRESFTGLIAVDATSSMGGAALPWKAADVWYASVQKCFGLPSGLAVMVLSPAAVERAESIGERAHYNSLAFILENFRKFQTPYTPNILGIYLLRRLMESLDSTDAIGRELEKRSTGLYDFLEHNGFQPAIRNPLCRSGTVLAVRESREAVTALKAFAGKRDMVLGNGYGAWKETSFRLANFPAIEDAEFEELKKCLLDFKASQKSI